MTVPEHGADYRSVFDIRVKVSGARGLVRSRVQDFVRHHPLVAWLIRWPYLRFIRGYRALPHPFHLIHVDPSSITHAINDEVYWWYYDLAGSIFPGDWDQNTRPVKKEWKYIDMINRFSNDVPWINSSHYEHMLAEDMHSDEILAELTAYDRIFDDIKSNGYQSSFQLSSASYGEDVCVCIGRAGDILFSGSGWHRLTIAQILKLPSIPVRVTIRHADWQQIRDMARRSPEALPERLKGHPDLKHTLDTGFASNRILQRS